MQLRLDRWPLRDKKHLARRVSRVGDHLDRQDKDFSPKDALARPQSGKQRACFADKDSRQDRTESPALRNPGRAHVVVVGNAKGGTGKSTIAMHLIVALLKQGYSVASLDLDGWQGTLSRYVENRETLAKSTGADLAMPNHGRVQPSDTGIRSSAHPDGYQALKQALTALTDHDFLVIDTPGSNSGLSRSSHTLADTLITPLNDSFLDLDLLVRVKADGKTIVGPTQYTELVWKQRQMRAISDRPPTDWIVLCNRLTHVDARNKREVADLLERAAKRMAFRLAPGFGERVIFRELFHKGLTLLDLPDAALGIKFTLSHLAARQEIHALLDTTNLLERHAAESRQRPAKPLNQTRSTVSAKRERFVIFKDQPEPRIFKIPVNQTARLINENHRQKIEVFETLEAAKEATVAIIDRDEAGSRGGVKGISGSPSPQTKLRRAILNLTQDTVELFYMP